MPSGRRLSTNLPDHVFPSLHFTRHHSFQGVVYFNNPSLGVRLLPSNLKGEPQMANISKRNRRRERELQNAAKNRREIIAAQLSRRDMMKAGLLTSAGYLIHKNG